MASYRIRIPFERVLTTIEALRRAYSGLNNAKLQAKEPDLEDPSMTVNLELPDGVTVDIIPLSNPGTPASD